MKIASLSKVILDLLEKGKEVSLEGIGNFFIKKESARIDEKSSIAHPPTQTILFNPNIYYNDSELLHHVADLMSLDLEVAKRELSELLGSMIQRIRNGEIVTLDGIGSLLIDENQRIKFKELDSVGGVLPQVELPNLTKSIDETPLVMVRNGRGFIDNKVKTAVLIPFIVIVILGLLQIMGFDFWKKDNSLAVEKLLAEVPPSRINSKPQDVNEFDDSQQSEKNTLKIYPSKELQPGNLLPTEEISHSKPQDVHESDNSKPSEKNTVKIYPNRELQPSNLQPAKEIPHSKSAETQKGTFSQSNSGTAFIGVGYFSLEQEAKKLQTSIERVNYETVIRPSGNYLQLGVIVPYQSRDQLNAILLSLRRNFVSDAKIETFFYQEE